MKNDKEFFQGMAVVIAALVRDCDEPVLAANILVGNGVRLSNFKGVDVFDMKHIRKLYREETQLKGLL